MFVYSTPFEIKRASLAATGEFEGHGAVFGNVDLGFDVIEPGAFSKSLAAHKSEGTRPAMFWSHDPREPIGTWLDVREDDKGLAVRGKLTLDVPRAAAAHALMKDGALGLSIGYRVPDGGLEYDRQGVRHLKEIDLLEVSPVGLPMNRRATITAVKGQIKDIRGFETAVRDVLGFSAREAKRIASGGWKALGNEQSTTQELDDVLSALRSAVLKLGANPNGSSRNQGRDR